MKNNLLFLILITFLFSCSSKQQWNVEDDLSGSVSYNLYTEDFLNSYFKDIIEGVSGEEFQDVSFQIFSPDQITKELQALPGVFDIQVKESMVGQLQVSFSFGNLQTLLDALQDDFPLSIAKEEGIHHLSFYLDRKNIGAFFDIAALPEDDMLLSLLPSEENPITAEEYKELLSYLFEEYKSSDLIMKKLDELKVYFSFTVPASIKTIEGGTAKGRVASFSIPLLKLLSLEEPIQFSLSY